jgi:hypothetical protein
VKEDPQHVKEGQSWAISDTFHEYLWSNGPSQSFVVGVLWALTVNRAFTVVRGLTPDWSLGDVMKSLLLLPSPPPDRSAVYSVQRKFEGEKKQFLGSF